MYTFQAIQIFLFLIPGFISSRFLDTLVIRKQEQKDLASIIEALIFSMVIYTIYSSTSLTSPITLDQINSSFAYNYDVTSFITLLSISILLPLTLAFVINNDLHMRLARFLKITRKTSRLSVWQDIFYDKEPLVIIDFADGRRLFGWVEFFSDEPDKPYLYIAQPQWVIDNQYEPTNLEGILVTPEQKISFIEFLQQNDLKKSELESFEEKGKSDVKRKGKRNNKKS